MNGLKSLAEKFYAVGCIEKILDKNSSSGNIRWAMNFVKNIAKKDSGYTVDCVEKILEKNRDKGMVLNGQ